MAAPTQEFLNTDAGMAWLETPEGIAWETGPHEATGGGAYAPTSTSSTTSSGTSLTQQEIDAYNQAIGNTNQAIERLPNKLESGYQTLDSQSTDDINQLLLGKNRAEGQYGENKLSTGKDYVGSKNTIGSQAGSLLTGLWRLLGSRGAGGGTTFRNLAPNAVARQATLQRNDVSGQFGNNMRLLDTNWNNFLTDYSNSQKDVQNQRSMGRDKVRSLFQTNKAELLQQLAELTAKRDQNVDAGEGYLDKANTLLDSASKFDVDPLKYKVGAYTAPSLESYVARPGATPTYQGQAASNDYTSPYLAALLRKNKPLNVAA